MQQVQYITIRQSCCRCVCRRSMQALVAEPEDHIKAASAWSLGQIGRHTPDHARALAEGDVLRHLLVRNTLHTMLLLSGRRSRVRKKNKNEHTPHTYVTHPSFHHAERRIYTKPHPAENGTLGFSTRRSLTLIHSPFFRPPPGLHDPRRQQRRPEDKEQTRPQGHPRQVYPPSGMYMC